MLSKIYKILFFNILLLTVQSYAVPPLPPGSPPPLPIQETESAVSVNEKPQELSTFAKIKQFFYKPKVSPAPQTIEKENKLASKTNITNINEEPEKDNAEGENLEPFIDLGDAKLPTAASHNVDHELKSPNDFPTNINLASNNIKATPIPMTPNVPAPMVSVPPPAVVNPPTVAPQAVSSPPPVPSFPPTPMPIINSPVNAKAVNTTTTPTAPVDSPVSPPQVVPATESTDETNSSKGQALPITPNVPPPLITTPPSTPVNIPPPQTPSLPNSSMPEANPAITTQTASPADVKEDWDAPLQPVRVVSIAQNQSTPSPVLTQKVQQLTSSPIDDKKITPTQPAEEIESNVMSSAATKFAKDETQMLLLPNDDIVLGKLTDQAKLEQMDMYSYIKLAQKKEEWLANATRREAVNNFIKYDDNLNKKAIIYSNLSYCDAIQNAFTAVKKNNLFSLRALLDVYPILQDKNKRGETLLTVAAQNDNYYLAKFLVIRGIRISALNSECQNALDIALARNNNNITCMLTKAKGW
ncbi:hypothetical protein [Rickettsia endosymbiont of Halotydeus destructor]|uniref:hypothetical protein n=1 Tax=Rickettsia endosymbiont of Halotydeus destructor TaxID=2996754 RepID=UPI003BB0FF74